MTEMQGILALDESWASRVSGGVPSIELSELADLPSGITAGAALALHGPEGRLVGYGLFDPENGVLRTLPAAEDERFDGEFVGRRVSRALALRRRLGLVKPGAAYRLLNAEGDELAGLHADVYAQHVVLSVPSANLEEYAVMASQAIDAQLRPQGIVLKIRPPGESAGGLQVRVLAGEPPPRQLVVEEDDLRFEVHLMSGLNTGLFCDMREVRRLVRGLAAGRRALNTFCYTGSLSLALARGGAASVTSVDFAGGVLNWAKTNFRLSDLDPQDRRYHFVRADAFDFLKTARRKQDRYDLVILDPPATTAVPGRRWYMKSDYDRLIGHALRIMPPGGILVVVASTLVIQPDQLDRQIRAAGRELGRRLRLLAAPSLPFDFPTQMIHPQSRHLKCSVLHVD